MRYIIYGRATLIVFSLCFFWSCRTTPKTVSVEQSEPGQLQINNSPLTVNTLETKAFYWGELKAGDCRQIEGALILRSDGTARFDAVTWTWTTHSGDYWHTGLPLTDSSGVVLHNEPYHQGPRMDDGSPPPRYRWGFDFTFDRNKFSQIQAVRQSFKC